MSTGQHALGAAGAGPCPCGTGAAYDACCGPLHRGARRAETAVELMRSRYSAFALGHLDHLFRTWHPRTRPAGLLEDGLDPAREWTGLEVLDHGEDWVEFAAHHRDTSPAGVASSGTMRERSRFERRAGHWVYVDGTFGG
ncbi:SEC-C motif-containing protein [Nocardioides salarius]|uniref:UPF0225 protein JOE61_001221 n=1 Tax=Nocardioides salarius TaxID=374513 RepID=A0ABS2M8A2_9ACTN|nr:YchJ family metal-binding protein [Nocardioides salarius]MBM7507407.1 SEC-C motif-containing protein [Nocardioides salarius]